MGLQMVVRASPLSQVDWHSSSIRPKHFISFLLESIPICNTHGEKTNDKEGCDIATVFSHELLIELILQFYSFTILAV